MKEFLRSLISDGSKVSSKRVLSLLFSLVAVYLLIFEAHTEKLDSLLFFIAGLVGFTVANNHNALQNKEKKDGI